MSCSWLDSGDVGAEHCRRRAQLAHVYSSPPAHTADITHS